ncbi:hypothetical protein HAX54_008654 [Datura stramonium]|uniref:Uncharacterized protein n=1 Tax=Datura stramonium TaxID=4076 RepID=A0ABS8TEY0_DATST|nr:hypothetical protein [Datura stramonium]
MQLMVQDADRLFKRQSANQKTDLVRLICSCVYIEERSLKLIILVELVYFDSPGKLPSPFEISSLPNLNLRLQENVDSAISGAHFSLVSRISAELL